MVSDVLAHEAFSSSPPLETLMTGEVLSVFLAAKASSGRIL